MKETVAQAVARLGDQWATSQYLSRGHRENRRHARNHQRPDIEDFGVMHRLAWKRAPLRPELPFHWLILEKLGFSYDAFHYPQCLRWRHK